MSTWLAVASEFLGTREIKGPKHSSTITGWLDKLGAWWRDDETPWCGVFVAFIMQLTGIAYPTYYMRAKSWLDWGQKIKVPVYGCIAVFDRKGGGHVGFVVGRDEKGNLLILGGNQGDEVNIRAFPSNRVLGYRLPPKFDYRLAKAVPVYPVGVIPMTRGEA